MSTTVTYKGVTITTAENQTRTLATSGKWLEADIVIADVTQNSSGTPAISVVDTTDSHGGTVREITALDISDTTTIASDVASGKYFYTANGIKTLGTGNSGGSSGYTRTIIAEEQTVTPVSTSLNGSTYYGATLNISEGFEADVEYIITFNDTEYFFTCQVLWGTNYLLGDINYFYGGSDLPYPFGIIWRSGTTCTLARNNGNQVTVKIEKLELTGTGNGTGQTATGTVTGDGTNVLEIPCNFAPDLIYVYGDMSGDVANRGVTSVMIIKDAAIYASFDSSASNTDEYATVSRNITGYNESDTSYIHATYSNNTLTIDTVQNSTSSKWRSGQVYNYELSTIGTGGGSSSPTLVTKEITSNGTYTASNDSADGYSSVTVNVPSSGITPTGSINITTNGTHDVTNYASAVVNVSSGGTPSATAHTIYFEFSDNTNMTITAYWDDSFISNAITATTPTEYGGKTVDSASLDGVTWYTRSTETWETMFDGNMRWEQESQGDYPYCWLTEFGSTPITVGSVWRVTYNNTEYRCTGKSFSVGGYDYTGFGNPVWSGGTDDGSGVPFVFMDYTVYGAWTGGLNVPNVSSSYYFKIERLVTS